MKLILIKTYRTVLPQCGLAGPLNYFLPAILIGYSGFKLLKLKKS